MKRGWVRKVGLSLAAVIVSLVVMLFVALATIWWKPSIVVNEPFLSWGYERYFADDYPASWASWEVKADSPSFWKKSFKIEWYGLCLKEEFPGLTGCLDQLRLGAVVDLENWDVRVDELDPLVIQGDNLVVTQTAPGPQEEEPAKDKKPFEETISEWRQKVNDFLADVEVGEVLIDLNDLRIEQPEQGYLLSLFVQPKEGQEVRQGALEIRLKEKSLYGAPVEHNVDLQAELSSSGPNLTGRWTISYDLTGSWDDRNEISSQGRIEESSDKDYLLNLAANYVRKQEGRNLEANVDVSALGGFAKIAGTADVRIAGLTEALPWLDFKACEFRAPVIYEASQNPPDFFLDCTTEVPIPLAPEVRKDLESVAQVEFPRSAVIDLRAELEPEFIYEPGQEGTGEIHLKLHPIQRKYLTAEGEVSLQVDGNISQPWQEWQLQPSLNLLLAVEDFGALTEAVRQSNFGVPAPLNVLDGELWVRAKGSLDVKGGQYRIPVSGRTDLASKGQKVNTWINGFVMLNPQDLDEGVYLDLKTRIDEIALQLPPLNPVAGIPSLTPDPRFKDLEELEEPEERPSLPPEMEPELRTPLARRGVEENEDEGIPFEYRISVKTRRPDSIKLYSNLAKPYVPIGIDLMVRSGAKSYGTVDVNEFKVSYLRREAVIHNFQIELPKGEEDKIEVDGLLVSHQADYEIFVKVVGSVDQPRVHLYSNPPLPRDDILAVLLFNRPLDDLAGYEEESVGNVQAAITDGAIGLFGLWAFASTPIQSVSYNPETKNYAAKIALDEDLTFTIGGDWERVQTLRLRKRLARNWQISTILDPATEGEDGRGEVMLQWQNRY